MARGKVFNMKGIVVKAIPGEKRQLWFNKEAALPDRIHIEEWFDDWLNESDDYWRQTYRELQKFESEFYYLKEFVCQIEKGAWLATVTSLGRNGSIKDSFRNAEMLVPSAESPFEKLLMNWIVADYVYRHKEKKDIAGYCYNIDVCDFYNKVKAIVLKETEQYPIKIKIKEAYNTSAPGVNYVFNSWRLVENIKQKSATMGKTKNTTEKNHPTTEDIVKELESEVNLKNQAYYFILQKGYLNEFKKYCDGNLVGQPHLEKIQEIASTLPDKTDNTIAQTKTNHIPIDIKEHHTKAFYKTIEDFLRCAAPAQYQRINNDLLNCFVPVALDADEYSDRDIVDAVYMITLQNQFITELKENWENFKRFNEIKF